MLCVVFDIDGTLANIDHRSHLIPKKGGDWKPFFDAMVNDTPNDPVVNCLTNYAINPMYDVFICTGRPETHREITEKWLDSIGALYDQLMMRGEKDYRSDVVVKREMLQKIRDQGYEIEIVFEDRKKVKKMYVEEGVFVCDVNQNDEEF